MKYKGLEIGSYMKTAHVVTGTRFTDDVLCSVSWEIEFEMVSICEDANKVSWGIERALMWLDTLRDVIIISPDDSPDFTNVVMGMTDNNIMFVPYSATDELIVILFHKKLQSLLEGICAVGNITLKASDNAIMTCYLPDTETEIEIPLEDYLKGYKRIEADNWWLRNDGFSIEFAIPDSIDADVDEIYSDIVDPLLVAMGTYDERETDNEGEDGARVIKFINGD